MHFRNHICWVARGNFLGKTPQNISFDKQIWSSKYVMFSHGHKAPLWRQLSSPVCSVCMCGFGAAAISWHLGYCPLLDPRHRQLKYPGFRLSYRQIISLAQWKLCTLPLFECETPLTNNFNTAEANVCFSPAQCNLHFTYQQNEEPLPWTLPSRCLAFGSRAKPIVTCSVLRKLINVWFVFIPKAVPN